MSEILFAVIFSYLFVNFLLPHNNDNNKNGFSKYWMNREILMKILIVKAIYFVITISILAVITKINLHVLYSLLILTSLHISIDALYSFIKILNNDIYTRWKIKINNTLYLFNSFILFQLLHIIAIIGILNSVNLISYNIRDIINLIGSFLFSNDLAFSDLDKFFLIGSLVVFTTYFSAHLLRILLTPLLTDSRYIEKRVETIHNEGVKNAEEKVNKFSEKRNRLISVPQVMDQKIEYDKEERTIETITEVSYELPKFEIGRYIGLIERLIILLLVINNAFVGLTFLIALKAVTRFKQFDDKSFAEYYLIGNLLSILFGIIGGLLVVLVLTSS